MWRGGVRREEFWITSKLWNDKHAEADVIPACRKSLADLRLEYLDMYLVHWPFPNFHPPGCDVDSRSPDARPYIHENFMRTWRQMEKLVELGLVRHIGTSNMTIPKLKLLLRDCRIRPAVNEMEMHPHFQQPELFDFVRAKGIEPVAYCPLGSPHRPERDRTPEDTVDMEDPVIVRDRRGGWACIRRRCACGGPSQRGADADSLFHQSAELSGESGGGGGTIRSREADMRAIAGIDRNCRLIKGQVFLWKDGAELGRPLGPGWRDRT